MFNPPSDLTPYLPAACPVTLTPVVPSPVAGDDLYHVTSPADGHYRSSQLEAAGTPLAKATHDAGRNYSWAKFAAATIAGIFSLTDYQAAQKWWLTNVVVPFWGF